MRKNLKSTFRLRLIVGLKRPKAFYLVGTGQNKLLISSFFLGPGKHLKIFRKRGFPFAVVLLSSRNSLLA